METISPDLVLLIIGVGKPVHISLLRHGLVECCVKHPYHRGIGHQLPAGIDPDQVGRIVQGCQVIAFFHRLQHLIRDDHGLGEFLSPMDYPVSHGPDLIQVLHHTCGCIGQRLQHQTDGLCMVRHGCHRLLLLATLWRIRNHAAFNADPLTESLGQTLLRLGVNELEF